MNTTTTISGVERLNDAGPAKGHDPDGKPYWTRLITCHGGGRTVTLVLHAYRPDALELLPRKSIEADLAEMNNDTLDALANAVRAERQFRDRHPEGCSCGAPDCPQWEADQAGCARAELIHPRDCAPVSLPAAGSISITEDDGEPPF